MPVKCNTCKEVLPKSKFSKNRLASTGLQRDCKVCTEKRRSSKGKASKEEAILFVKSLVKAEKVFECKCCKQSKSADQFYHQRDYGKVRLATSRCKECQKHYQRLKTFGVSVEMFDRMLTKQGNKCRICCIDHDEYTKTSYNNKKFAVDHCHKSGKIRGLLCEKCNRGLGFFDDDIEKLLAGIKYLEGDDMV